MQKRPYLIWIKKKLFAMVAINCCLVQSYWKVIEETTKCKTLSPPFLFFLLLLPLFYLNDVYNFMLLSLLQLLLSMMTMMILMNCIVLCACLLSTKTHDSSPYDASSSYVYFILFFFLKYLFTLLLCVCVRSLCTFFVFLNFIFQV